MEDDGAEDLSQATRRTSKGFFNQSRILLIVLFFAGLIVGLAVEHQFVEPLLNTELTGGLNQCLSKNKLLDQEIQDCLSRLGTADSNSGV